jgi:hypothetical protein
MNVSAEGLIPCEALLAREWRLRSLDRLCKHRVAADCHRSLCTRQINQRLRYRPTTYLLAVALVAWASMSSAVGETQCYDLAALSSIRSGPRPPASFFALRLPNLPEVLLHPPTHEYCVLPSFDRFTKYKTRTTKWSVDRGSPAANACSLARSQPVTGCAPKRSG